MVRRERPQRKPKDVSWSLFIRNDNGSFIALGINKCRCIVMQSIAGFFERCCVGCLGHGLGLPPGSQPNLHHIRRLHSALEIGGHTTGSLDTDRRQLVYKQNRLVATVALLTTQSALGTNLYILSFPSIIFK